jgi:pimeloyl-ACP methyl ester carboxylesterase
MKGILAAIAFAFVATAVGLSSCVSIDEGIFFQPQAARRAASTAEMNFPDQRMLTERTARGPLQGRLPAIVTHEFVDLGGERLATSRVVPANARAGEPLIVHCGGNATDRINAGVFYSEAILRWGEALLFDYPGYGDSSGRPSIATFNATLPALGSWIDARAKGRPLVLWGQSIGGLICSRLASHSREVDAVILETTGVSPVKMVQEKARSIPFLNVRVHGGFEDYDIARLLKGFTGPVLVVGAGRDEVLPPVLARNLSKALTVEGLDVTYLEVAGADHMTASRTPDFDSAAQAFFSRVKDSRH